MSLNVEKSENLEPSKAVYSSGNCQSQIRPNLAHMVDCPITLLMFRSKNPWQQAHHKQSHCHDARFKSSPTKSIKPINIST